ncbi:MAG: hypothetical protein OXK79_04100 [Chloroflexota bacterium]|nr:hypothetical protein [Chloroflexota bacterium]
MQGYILTTESDRSFIVGDDGVRYKFNSPEWQSKEIEPEAGMRVDFEVRGSDAVEIYPIPGASPMESMHPSPAPSTMGDTSPATPHADLAANERFKAALGRTRNRLIAHYSPIREAIGDYGVIAAGIVLLASGTLIRFDILETIVDLVAMLGMIVGAAAAGFGIFMLGREEGWWGEDGEPGAQSGASPAPPAGVPSIRPESRGMEGPATEDTPNRTQEQRRMKNCPSCDRRILYAAIKCRYCGSDVPTKTG